jgi:hypothetical protein
VRQRTVTGRAGIERLIRQRRAHRIGIDSATHVGRDDEPRISPHGAAGPSGETIEPPIERAAERPVALIGEPALPALAGLAGHHVHHAGERLAVARREAVGGERRLAEEVGRQLNAEPAARRVQPILEAQPVDDEGLLADTAAAVARPDGSGGEGDRLLERADGQVAQVRRGDLLLGRGGERVEHRVVGRGDDQGRELLGICLELEVDRDRAAGADEHAVEHDAAIADEPGAQPMPPRASGADPVASGSVGDGGDGIVQQHFGPGERPVARGGGDLPSNRPLSLGRRQLRSETEPGDGDAERREELRRAGHRLPSIRNRSLSGCMTVSTTTWPLTGSCVWVTVYRYPSATTLSPAGERAGRR